jgi:hypothetical protein
MEKLLPKVTGKNKNKIKNLAYEFSSRANA